jgi:tetratricopeptide (TPR) repeat protein
MGASATSIGSNNAYLSRSLSSIVWILAVAGLLLAFQRASVIPIVHGSNSQSEAAEHGDKGLQLASAGDLSGAEIELREAVRLAPDNSRFLANLGTVLAMENKLEDSSSIFERALKLDPGDVTVRRYLAANLWQLNRCQEARQHLELILKGHPDDKQSRLLLGMVAENMKDYATALKMLASVPGEVRKQPESTAALARCYYHFGQKENARRTLADLVTNAGGEKGVLLGAQIADQAQDYGTAESLLTSIRSNFPDPAMLGYRLALVQYHAKQFEESQKTLLDLLAAGYKSGQILNLLAWCYEKRNDSKEAVHALEEAINLGPPEESNYVDLIQILSADGSLPRALATAKRASEALPGSSRMFLLKGSIELKVGQFTDAIASYAHAVELDPASADGLLGLAQAEDAAGMIQDATARYEAGITRFPKDARFKLQFALMLLKEGQTGDSAAQTRAEQLLRSAVAQNHSLPEAHYQLGDLALKSGHPVEAVQELKQAAQLDPKSAKACYALARAYRRLGRNEDAAREMDRYQKLKEAEPGPVSSPAGIPQ